MKYGLIEYIDEHKKHYSYVTLDVIKEKMGIYHASINDYELTDSDYISFVNRYVRDVYIGDWIDVWFLCIDKRLLHDIYERLCPYADCTHKDSSDFFIIERYIDFFKHGYQTFLNHMIKHLTFSHYVFRKIIFIDKDLANRIKHA